MPAKRMLSKRQCIFVIVVLPILLIPAFIILRIAEPKHDMEMILLNKMPRDKQHLLRKSANKSAKPLVKPKPRKCTDYIWSGICHDTCHKFNTKAKQTQRRQQVFVCEKAKTRLKMRYTPKARFVHKTEFGDMCLSKIADSFCRDSRHKVPNIVHYVWFGKNEFKFVHLLSFLSVHKFQQPCLIMVHADRMPKGELWRYFLQISPKVVHVHRKQPKKVYKKKIDFIEHKADIAKLEALKEYGGIYLDTDQVLLKPVDKFRNFDATIGLEYENAPTKSIVTAAHSVVIAKKNSLFIKFWLESYRSFSRLDGNRHSNVVPYELAKKQKDLVHMAGDVFSNPHHKQLSLLYSRNMDWSRYYGVHLHAKVHDRLYGSTFTMDSIRTSNTTAGAIARYILYGNTDICENDVLGRKP